MEHRCRVRQAVVCMVEVIRQGRLVGQYRSRNMCREGMFLEVTDVAIPLGTLIELECDSGQGNSSHCRGIVIHSGPAGIGIMCLDHNPCLTEN